jgi:hypothetical protein
VRGPGHGGRVLIDERLAPIHRLPEEISRVPAVRPPRASCDPCSQGSSPLPLTTSSRTAPICAMMTVRVGNVGAGPGPPTCLGCLLSLIPGRDSGDRPVSGRGCGGSVPVQGTG